nr:hypothetical protein [Tanacetum cinerariifolium]
SNKDGNTTCVTTGSTAFPTGSVNVATISQDTDSAYIASQSNGTKAEEKTPKALMATGGVGWDWIYMANKEENHALVADEEAPTEFALMANTESKVKEGVGYNVVPPPAADLYLSPKKDLSWTGLPEFVDDTVTNYSRHSPTIASTSEEGQNKDSSTSEDVASPNLPKPFVKFVKPKDSQPESKSKEQETPKKSQVKYAEQYRHSNKKPKVKGNQRNWNNLKSYQLGPEFVLNKKACYNCGDFSHLADDCRKRVQRKITRSQNNTYKRPPPRSSSHRPHGGSMRPSYRPAGHRPHGPAMNPRRPTMNGARPYKSFFNQAPSYETRPFLKSSENLI